MKSPIKYLVYCLLGINLAMNITSCQKETDNEKDWGLNQVYMPQAAIDGGGDNQYMVPNSGNSPNFVVDTISNTITVSLGISRSGLAQLQPYSVKVNIDIAATDSVIASNSIANAVALPSDVYTIPSEVSVPANKRDNSFQLVVDRQKLLDKYPRYNNKKMVLVVGISNPTKYELNHDLAKTVVVINGSSFLPVPLIVGGGDFGSSIQQNWTRVNFGGSLDASAAEIKDGVLTFDYGTGTPSGDVYFYNTIELEQGKDYRFSCDFFNTGSSKINACRFYLVVSPNLPIATSYGEDSGYADSANTFFSILDAWNGMKNPVSGTLPQNGGWQQGIDKSSGIFTSDFSGTGYVIIGVVSWESPIGSVVIDNVKIEEQ